MHQVTQLNYDADGCQRFVEALLRRAVLDTRSKRAGVRDGATAWMRAGEFEHWLGLIGIETEAIIPRLAKAGVL